MKRMRHTGDPTVATAFRRLRLALALTLAGLWAERLARAFWPLVSVLMATFAALMLGAHRASLAPEVIWAAIAATSVLSLVAAFWGVRHLRPPRQDEALDRLDRTLPGRPITALGDTQAVGAGDTASRVVWRAHIGRMTRAVTSVRAVRPDPRLAPRDPLGLRLMALALLMTALIFGSLGRIGGLSDILPGAPASALAAGPSWEGWVEPPAYTGKPALYLGDLTAVKLTVPEGTRFTIRLYGELGALGVTETISGSEPGHGGESEPLTVFSFEAAQDGQLAIDGPGGKTWAVNVVTDSAPSVEGLGKLEWAAEGHMRQRFRASDDHGVDAGQAVIALDTAALDRRYGLAAEPEPRADFVLDLPLPFTGDRRDFQDDLAEDLSQHPWARLPVTMTLAVTDARGQEGASQPSHVVLPGRRFFDPLAKAVIEGRRDLLWTRDNGPRLAQVLRAVTHLPDDFMRDETVYLKLRTAIRRLEQDLAADRFDGPTRDALAQVLWDLAMEIEFGNLADAKARLERAQDRLSEAIKNGASDEEIAALMEEMRRAMEDYMRQLAQKQGQDGQQNRQAGNQQMQQLSGQDLQDMLDRLQELMQQGRMAEAEQLLDQLRRMMENMQVTRGQGQNGQQSPGEQSMEELAETLRQQQGLSDEAFRDLQEQFNRGATRGENPDNTGRDGGLGRGQSHQPGQGGPGQGQQGGQEGQPGQGAQGGGHGAQAQSLARRQGALRDELARQRGNLPGAGTEAGDAAREALGRAGDAMDRAEDNLRQNDLAAALDNQSEAIEALREGMRNLGEALARQQPNGQGQQFSDTNPSGQADPLGREQGANGRLGTDENLLQGDDVYRRARDLLDEIRRRSGDQSRPDAELEYLMRLLDRF